MTEPVNRQLYLDGSEVVTSEQLVSLYRERVRKFGLSGKTMFYSDEVQHQTKVAQFALLLQNIISPGDKLLDIGCGYGSLIPLLPPCNYVGIDIVPEFITYCKHRYPLLDFRLQDLSRYRGKSDWCILLGVVNGIPSPQKLIYKAWSKCRKGLFVDFVDYKKLAADSCDLNRFNIGDCLNKFLQDGAQRVDVYQTPNVWVIFSVLRQSRWLKARI